MVKKLGAEFLGTAWLVFGGCGSAVLAAGIPQLGIGFLGVSLAFGLTVLTTLTFLVIKETITSQFGKLESRLSSSKSTS